MTSLRRHFRLLLPLLLLAVSIGLATTGFAATGKVAAGAAHSAAIKADGSLWTWGANSRGQLGDGSTVQQSTPVQVPSSVNWAFVAAGGGATPFTLAVKADGTLWAWGDNSLGQLGFGVTDANPHPIPGKPNNDTDWLAVATGTEHALALKADGTVRAWGRNRNGQLGDGTTTNRSAPVSVTMPGGRRAVAVAAGGDHTLVLMADGTVWTAGGNRYGQLGQNIGLDPDGNTAHFSLGQVVTSGGPLTNVVAVAAGLRFSAALKADGTIWTWGRNDSGQLGVNSGGITESDVAVQVVAGEARFRAFAAGADFVLAAEADGHLFVWGNNSQGQLALGNTTPALALAPVQAAPANPVDWRYLAAGEAHGIGVKANGELHGWGGNAASQVGDGSFTTQLAPVLVGSDSVDWVSVEPGDFFTLARKSDGSLWGWGDNSFSQLGLVGSPTAPTRIDIGPYVAQSGGGLHSAAVLSDGSLFTWGDNSSGQLGNGTNNPATSPTAIGTAVDWIAVSTGFAHTVALNAKGELWAAGDNFFGQLGANPADPTALSLIDAGPWKAVVAGAVHTVALKADGSLWAWGDNNFGQIGDGLGGADVKQLTPKKIGTDTWVAIAAGDSHTLAIRADGTMHAWGLNAEGQLGDNSTVDKLVPAAVSATGAWTTVAAGSFHSLARKSDGSIFAWGSNVEGQIGNGASLPGTFVQVPTVVAGVAPVPTGSGHVGGGFDHSAAITADGRLWLWGGNANGQLGNGASGTNIASPSALTQAKVALSPASLGFGPVTIDATADLFLTIGNSGTAQLTMGAVTGLAGTDFSVVSGGTCGDGTTPFNIAAGATCTLQVRFTPTLANGVNSQVKAAALSMTTSSPDEPNVSVPLSGTAQRKFPIVASSAGNGTISPVGTVLVDPNASQLFTILPDAGNKLVDLLVDGVSVGPVSFYLFTDVTARHTIAASFVAADFADSWTWRNPQPTLHSLRRVAGNGAGLHVAVGDYGTILSSADNGATWSMVANGTAGLSGITFGNGTFVAVGNNGRIFTSTDGTSWVPRHSGVKVALRGVAFGNGTFVAVGNTDTNPTTLVPTATILTSTDGITWTPRLQTLPLNTTLDLHDVAFGSSGGNNVFVAAAQGGYLLKSADSGLSWLLNGAAVINPALALPAPVGLFDFNGVTFAAGTFVAVGTSGQVYTADIGASTWNDRSPFTFANFQGVAFGASKFVAVGAFGEIWTSGTGTTWTQRTSGLEATVLNVNGVTPAGSGLVAVGDDGTVLSSTDGITWDIPHPQKVNSSLLRDVHHANGVYVAVGDVGGSGSAILTSVNGTTWTSVANSVVNNLQGVAYGNGFWVAVGDSDFTLTQNPVDRAVLLTSADNGATWTSRASGASPNLNGIAFGNGVFVAVGDWEDAVTNAVILTSADGITWTRRANPALDILRRVTYANGRFVAVGDQGVVLVSTDGFTWTDYSLNFGPHFTGVAGTTGTIAAVASNSTQVYRSTDNGVTWTTASHAPADLPTGVLRGITYAAGQFLAVAESGHIFSSTNASSWSTRMGADIYPFGTRDLRGITFGNGRYVAVGSFGTVLQSAADAAQAAQPALSLSPSALQLAPVELGTTADTTFTATNRGGSDLTISSVTAGNAAFAVLNNTCTTLAQNASCTFTVRFTPVAPAGTVTTSALTIVSNDQGSPSTFNLLGSSKDTIAPDTTITANPADPSNNASPAISFTSPDGTATFQCSLDGAAFAACTSPRTLAGLADGSHTFRVRAVDPAGNTDATPASVTWNIDTVVPTTTAAPAGGLFNADQSVTLSANETATIRYTTDGSLPNGSSTVYSGPITISTTTTLRYFATDPAGNAETPKSAAYTIDKAAPALSVTPAASPTNLTGQTVRGTVEAGATVTVSTNTTAVAGPVTITSGTNWSSQITGLVAGANLVTVTATDAVGNVATQSVTIIVDQVAPSLTINAVTGLTNAASQAVTGSVESGAAVAVTVNTAAVAGSVTISGGTAWSSTITGLVEGANQVTVTATDAAGNSTVRTATITRDTVAPIVSASPAAGTFNTTQHVTLSANEPVTIYYTLDGGAPTAASTVYTGPIAINTTTTVRFFARDLAGNDSTPGQGAYVIDAVVPVTTASPVEGLYNEPINVTLVSSKPAVIRYTTDGSTPTLASPIYSGPVTISVTTTLKYYATDSLGNTETVKTGLYTIHTPDLTATVAINDGASATSSPNVILTLDAFDPLGVKSMRFSNDGVSYSSDEPYGTSKAWTLLPGDGLKTVYVRFTDNNDFLYPPFTAQITLDTVAPATTANPVAGTYAAAIDVALSAREAATIRYTVDGSDPSGASAIYAGPIPVTAATSPRIIKYFATDAAGNVEGMKAATYIVHAPDLVANMQINNGEAFVKSASVTLNISAFDAAGVVAMRLSNDGVTYTPDEAFQTTKAWTLAAGDGPKTVYIRITDGANVLYDPVVALVTLDTTTPFITLNPVTSPTTSTSQTIGGAVESGTSVTIATSGTAASAGPVTFSGSGPILNWSSTISGLTFGNTGLTITATDPAGNQALLNSGISFKPDGILTGHGGPPTVLDALRAARIAAGLITPTAEDLAHGDLAPLSNGAPTPDGVIDGRDVLIILRTIMGQVTL